MALFMVGLHDIAPKQDLQLIFLGFVLFLVILPLRGNIYDALINLVLAKNILILLHLGRDRVLSPELIMPGFLLGLCLGSFDFRSILIFLSNVGGLFLLG